MLSSKLLTTVVTTFGAEGTWGPANIITGTKDTIIGMGDSLSTIAHFLSKVSFYLGNPLDALKDFIITMMPFAHLSVLVLCALVILMAIMGHKKGLKFVPITFVCYLMMRVLSVVL